MLKCRKWHILWLSVIESSANNTYSKSSVVCGSHCHLVAEVARVARDRETPMQLCQRKAAAQRSGRRESLNKVVMVMNPL